MCPFQTKYRVEYSDTDQMGFMHHSNYLKFYETARWELFRSIGLPYAQIEKSGIILPVVDVSVKYIKPVLYDQVVIIGTAIKAITGARVIFQNQMFSENSELVNEAQITVAFVMKANGKACVPPKNIMDILMELV